MIRALSVFKFQNVSIFYRAGTADQDVLDHSFENDIFYASVPEYKSSPQATIIDIGAHIGTFSIYSAIASKGGKIYALEPNGESFGILEKNVRDNKLTGKVIPLQYALSDHEGSQKLYLDKENWGHSLTNTVLEDFEEVSTTTLSSLMEREQIIQCDLIKFNCEGAEFPIILSLGEQTLKKIKLMIILFHEDLAKGMSRRELMNFLSKHGFYVRVDNEDDKRGWIIAKNKEHFRHLPHLTRTALTGIKKIGMQARLRITRSIVNTKLWKYAKQVIGKA
jgi:FkbM family methyltransferase